MQSSIASTGSVPLTGGALPLSIHDVYQCPVSGQPLRWNPDRAVTADGAHSYVVHAGCPVFLSSANTESSTELDTVRRALALCRSVGWRQAVDEVYVPGTRGHLYITAESRAGFLDILPIPKDCVALEIGCSMGQHTSAIARRCSVVHGIDVIMEQALFARERCEQEGLPNVHVACGGDDGRLPYREGVFDLVILNLVLEWCGLRSSEPHEVIHRRLLGEIARVTKPGGVAFVSTKNRFALKLLLGGRDDHSHQLRFGSALPRRMLEGRVRRRKLARPLGWLHSYRELRQMILAAGFSDVESWWAIPDSRHPVSYIPASASSVRTARRHLGRDVGPSRVYRAILPHLPARMIKYVAPGLTFVAVRSRSAAH